MAVRRHGNKLLAVLGNEYGTRRWDRVVDQVVVKNGTVPADELYFSLRRMSLNLGEVDYDGLLSGGQQAIERNPEGRFSLFRIGDAVTSRNIHAAIYDGLTFT